jgi:hypothetical protein
VFGHLGVERPFQERLCQLLQQAVLADDVLGILVVGQQLINEIVSIAIGSPIVLEPIAVYTLCFTPSTRSADSTRTKSAGSSKVMVISGASFSPRSSRRARSRDRPMNASTDPDETVTRGDVFSVGFPTFFIFAPPETADFIIEPRRQRLVSGELERFLLSQSTDAPVTPISKNALFGRSGPGIAFRR